MIDACLKQRNLQDPTSSPLITCLIHSLGTRQSRKITKLCFNDYISGVTYVVFFICQFENDTLRRQNLKLVCLSNVLFCLFAFSSTTVEENVTSKLTKAFCSALITSRMILPMCLDCYLWSSGLFH